jgi:PKD repeat protein
MKQIYLLLSFFILLSCGSAFGQTYILNEDFSSASEITPPTGWSNTTVIGVATDQWRFDNLGIRTISYPFTGKFAIFDSDNYSQEDGEENVVLESKFFDASISNNTLLTFDHFFVGGKNGKGTLEIYNGSSWSTIATFTDSTAAPESKLYNISSNVGGITNAKIRFRWEGDASYYWAIDNIRIYAPLSRDAGMVKLNAPEMPFNSGNQDIKVSLGNFGIDALESTTLMWTVNGVAQTSKSWTGSLAIGEVEENIILANFNFEQGKPYNLKVWQENPNGQSDLNALNDTLYATLYCSLSGVYTIGGSSPDFKDFTEAVTVLNNAGVVGAVTFKVRDGVYNEQIVIGKVTGASATNTITFESESGDSTKAVLSYNESNSILDYTLLVNGGQYLSFKKLGFNRSSSSSIVKIEQGSKEISFSGCYFDADYGTRAIRVNATSNISITDSRLLGTYVVLEGSTKDVTISGNIISGSYYVSQVIRAYGSNNLLIASNAITDGRIALERTSNSKVTGNTIKAGSIYMSLYSYYGAEEPENNIISDNTIFSSSETGDAISVYGTGLTEISGNKITGVTNGKGMLLSSLQGTLVANNFVQTQGQGTTYGISLISSSDVKLVFNSVLTTGTDLSQARALSLGSGNSSLMIKNNIFSNSGGGYAAVIDAALSGTNDIDYNNYYSSGGKLGKYVSTDYTSLSSWGQAIAGDANSKAVNPFFKSNTELSSNHISLNNAGASIEGITKDIDGTTRDESKPDIGAREYVPAAVDAGIDAFISPTSPLTSTSMPVTVLLRNQGLNGLSSATINWQVNEIAQTPYNWTGSLASGASTEVTLNTHNFTGASIFNIDAWTSSPNGQPDPNRYNDTASVKNLVAALSGVYTIGGSSPDFKDFTEAVTVLNNAGVVGAVTFKVRDGVYNEQIVIGKVTGASATNTITFESESGDSTKAVLSYNESNSILDYTLLVNGGQYLSFKKLGFNRSSSSSIVKIEQGSKEISFSGCYFDADYGTRAIRVNATSNISITDSRLLGTYVVLEGSTKDVTISGNIISGSYYVSQVIRAYGSNNLLIASNAITDGRIALERTSNSKVTGNTIKAGSIYMSLYSYYGAEEPENNIISDNTIFSSSETGDAISVYGTGLTEISGNKITGVTNGKGMLLSSLQGTLVANNFVQTQGQGTTYGISLISSSDVKLVFNSVLTTGTDLSQARALSLGSGNSSLMIKNNIFSNSGGGYAAVIDAALSGTNDIDYNNYYSSGGKLGKYVSTDYTSLSSWGQAIAGDANSKAVNPFFKSTTDLRAYQRAFNGAGIPVAGVLLDIDGEIRNSSAPDMGADEFMVDFGITRLISPTLDCDLTADESVTVNVAQFGDIPFTDIKIAYQVNNGTIYTDTIKGQINTDIEHTFKNKQDLLQDGRYDFKLWLVGIQDDNLNNDTLYVSRFKKPRPVASFTFVTQCAGVAVPFKGEASVSPGSIARYEWDFGDGKTADVQSPNHIYELSGTYIVVLRAYSEEGCYGSVSDTIIITTTPEAKFADASACEGASLTFKNESTVSSGDITYLWDFGDGTSSTEEHPVKTYSAADTFKVELTASNSLGCSSTYFKNVTINELPTVTLDTLNPVCANAPDFNLTGGLPKGGSYSGDGVVDGMFSAATAGIGTHTIVYTYTNENGCTSTDTNTIEVKALPTVSFTGLPETICENAAAVSLSSSPTGGVWVGNGMNKDGVFSPATAGVGTHTVEYIYTDESGCTNKATDTIEVIGTSEALAATSNSPVDIGGTLELSITTIAGATYSWTGPDGFISASQNPSIANVTTANAGTYLATITVNGCTFTAATTVTIGEQVPDAPTVTSPVVYCQGATATALTATGENLKWYTAATGGTGSTTAPTPSTTTAGTTSYYVSQTVNGSESERAGIDVTINAVPDAPTVTSPVTYCQGATASQLEATGANLLWYTVATGDTGSTTALTPSTSTVGTTSYYVSQTVSGCESARAKLDVTINAKPTVTASNSGPVCEGTTLTLSSTSVSGATYSWTGPDGFISTSQNPSIANVTTDAAGTYSVTITVNGCTSTAAATTITVNQAPDAPTVTSPVVYCQDATATALTAAGENLKWYTTATGGTGSTLAPVPSTTTAGTTSYYVSQTVNDCESARAKIDVTIHAKPGMPVASQSWASNIEYNTNGTFAVYTVDTSYSYKWTLPAGFEIVSGHNTSRISVRATSGTASGSVTVKAVNSCGEGPALSTNITASKALASVFISDLKQGYDGEPKSVSVSTDPTDLVVDVTYNGSTTVPSALGEYLIKAVVVDNNYRGEAFARLTISPVTSALNPDEVESTALYPNPTADRAMLKLGTGTTAQVIVTDVLGRIIKQATATEKYEVNLEGLSSGMYLVRVAAKGKAPVILKLQKL